MPRVAVRLMTDGPAWHAVRRTSGEKSAAIFGIDHTPARDGTEKRANAWPYRSARTVLSSAFSFQARERWAYEMSWIEDGP